MALELRKDKKYDGCFSVWNTISERYNAIGCTRKELIDFYRSRMELRHKKELEELHLRAGGGG